ncbi:hypothetical protein A9976_21135 [Delftia sp. UME58]|nr:hypothetical protein [Delftia sp. UME58]
MPMISKEMQANHRKRLEREWAVLRRDSESSDMYLDQSYRIAVLQRGFRLFERFFSSFPDSRSHDGDEK